MLVKEDQVEVQVEAAIAALAHVLYDDNDNDDDDGNGDGWKRQKKASSSPTSRSMAMRPWADQCVSRSVRMGRDTMVSMAPPGPPNSYSNLVVDDHDDDSDDNDNDFGGTVEEDKWPTASFVFSEAESAPVVATAPRR